MYSNEYSPFIDGRQITENPFTWLKRRNARRHETPPRFREARMIGAFKDVPEGKTLAWQATLALSIYFHPPPSPSCRRLVAAFLSGHLPRPSGRDGSSATIAHASVVRFSLTPSNEATWISRFSDFSHCTGWKEIFASKIGINNPLCSFVKTTNEREIKA